MTTQAQIKEKNKLEKYKKSRKTYKSETGITIVTLVITIIVLLILSGITIFPIYFLSRFPQKVFYSPLESL